MRLRALLCAATLLAAPAVSADETLVAVVGQTGGVVRLLPVGGGTAAYVDVGDLPAGVAIGPDGRTLYVTDPDHGRVTVLDAVTRQITARFPVKGQPFGAAATDEFLYLTDWTRGVVIKLDVLTGATVGETKVGKSPAAIILDKSGGRAFVAVREEDAVGVLDLGSAGEPQKIKVGKAPFALALSPDGARLYVANVQSGDLSVIDVAGGREIKRVAVGRMPYGVAVTPDGRKIAVTLQHDSALAIVDAEMLEATARVKVGSYPEGVSIAPDGRTAAVANWMDDTVSLVDLDAARVTGTLPAEGGPRNLVVVTQ
ncbi:YncE family protein [Hansschlegelia zhihuaiae]|uniref:YncE family protein n=1 Tax=Hansschlegelia zhihuaiae TaxID=405005 RepID=A0A4Q0MJ37_9HYPH|nr:YncE family protein [Hansschlegelia zhihuaiae]RXF73707.1 YncE family protein [Hansschlegelia zhihuaiae]